MGAAVRRLPSITYADVAGSGDLLRTANNALVLPVCACTHSSAQVALHQSTSHSTNTYLLSSCRPYGRPTSLC